MGTRINIGEVGNGGVPDYRINSRYLAGRDAARLNGRRGKHHGKTEYISNDALNKLYYDENMTGTILAPNKTRHAWIGNA